MSSKKSANDVMDVVEEQTESQEITGTLTDVREEVSSSPEERIRSLLGSKSLKKSKERKVLLMLENTRSREGLIYSENVNQPHSGEKCVCILGPFSVSALKAKLLEGQLRKTDRVMFSGNRWKPLLEEFPDWGVHVHSNDEFSRTVEFTQTSTLTSGTVPFSEDEGSSPTVPRIEEADGLELEEVEDEVIRASTPVPAAAVPEKKKAPVHPQPSKSLEIERVEELSPKSESRSEAKTKTRSQSEKAPGMGPIQLTLLLTVFLGTALIFFSRRDRGAKSEEVTMDVKSQASVAQNAIKKSAQWPLNLQPLSLDSLYQEDSPVMKRIRPLMRAYEAGITSFSSADEILLRRIADPASSSWVARKIASNQLAVHYLSKGDTRKAREILLPILQEAPDDFPTLVNTALIDISEGKMSQARETLRVAFRIEKDMHWLTLSLLGMLEGLSGRWADANKNFQDAVARNPNNPYILGLWLQTLLKQGKGVRFQIQKLVEDALWADPDTLVDSPIPAPLAGHLFYSEALEGLIRGGESLGNALSPAKLSFLRWLKGRVFSFSPLTQPLPQVMKELELDDDLQAQVLYAYTLKEQRRFDESAAVLTKVLPLVEDKKITNSSWPWTLAGDVALARDRYDQAITLFQSALNRNNFDYSAVHGLALTLRDRGQYADAVQKLKEALSLQPNFMPSKLRMTRFEWQAVSRAQ
jgi:tetratricopeptide (TPR) repeat protein